MKGFSLKTGNDTIYAALESGSVGIIISNADGDYHITLNGMDVHGVYYVWQNNKLCVGDSITIKYDTIDKLIVSDPISIRVNDIKSKEQQLLDSYYKLKQELLDEGLISE